jgi:peptidoglycan-associated lipoprotein
MKFASIVKIFALVIAIVGVAACSSTKSGAGAPVQDETQTAGLGDQSGFADENSPNRLKAPYNQTYHFEFNKYDVLPGDVDSVKVQGDYLAAHVGAKVRLEGNADERGSREYNVTLGYKRAKAVAAILKQQGAADSQVALVSYGKEKPVALGHSEEDYAKNRRVDLVYEAK